MPPSDSASNRLRNFDLRLTGSPGSVTVEVEAGERQTRDPVFVGGAELAGISLSTTSSGGDILAAGQALWNASLGHRDIVGLWRASHPETGLRLRLIIDMPALAMLPWEVLHDPELDFLALRGNLAITRFIREPFTPQPWPRGRPLRFLFTGASPEDLPTLQVAAEWEGIKDGLQLLVDNARVAPQPIPDRATLDDLLAALRRQVDIWHFAGHAYTDRLLFADHNNHADGVDAVRLGRLVAGEGLSLAVINACRAGSGAAHPATVAGALVEKGVPAVVAMQADVPDRDAVILSAAFYDAIAVGQPVDRALTAARKAVYGRGRPAWWMPALFMRSPDGVIWQTPAADESMERQPRKPESSSFAALKRRSLQRRLEQLMREFEAVNRQLEGENNPQTRERLETQLTQLGEDIARLEEELGSL